ncbi:uncharacterized protein LOC143195017 isoform X1 [Rhynchophorus ferrugineus]|uniref:uncharacterized protein LOC143195017 isoform X1 n=1 Tax=Rhynchophorus ferrugineus TaxID=354439 RepID=UPI003FCDEA7A
MKYPQLVSMPSAVSDWLKEQLKARGIDSELYARLLLSLLHAHTRDLIHPEDPYPSPPAKKDGGRNVAGHRRVRRAAHWWRNARLDPEQVKRSAAVECLMSAADQNCEVESLVDELCAKLKEVDSDSSPIKISTKPSEDCKKIIKPQKVSNKELAEKYYAAFPPLNQKEGSYITSNINLVVGKWPSPDKSLDKIDLISAAKWTPGSPKKSKKKLKQRQNNEPSMKLSRNNKNRLGHKKANCVKNLSREMEYNVANWEFVYNNNNNNNTKDRHSLISDQSNHLLENTQVPKRVPDLLDHDLESFFDQKNLEQLQSELLGAPDITGGFLQLGTPVSKVWSPSRHICAVCNKPKKNHDDDLPLVNSIRFMEKANLKLNGFGTIRNERRFGHIIGGMEYDDSNTGLSGTYFLHGERWFEFVPCVSGKTKKRSYSFLDYLRSLSSTACDKEQDEAKRCANMKPQPPTSAFARYIPQNRQSEDLCIHSGPQPYRSKFGKPVRGPPLPEHVRPKQLEPSNPEPTEDMWGSTELYFRPIKPAHEELKPPQKTNYPDGAMFAINNNWDNIDFKKNEMGQLYVQCADGEKKVYQKYKSDSTVLQSIFDRFYKSKDRFNIKFEIKQNNKGCQTDDGGYVGLLTTIPNFEKSKPLMDPWDVTGLAESYLSGLSDFEIIHPSTVAELEELAGISRDDFIVKNILETLLDEKDVSCEEQNSKNAIWDEKLLKNIWSTGTEQVRNFNNRPNIKILREEAEVEWDLLLEEVSGHQLLDGTVKSNTVDISKTHSEPSASQPQTSEPENVIEGQNNMLIFDDCLINLPMLPLHWQNLINQKR